MAYNFPLNERKKTLIILTIIIFVGAFLRLFWLDKSPPSLNWDEAALGYNAYSLAKTGKDEYGHKLPLVLRSFDDYKPALYSYLTIPFIKVFGLNEKAVRAPSALAGIATILLIFLLANHFFKRRVALLAAALIAIEPWSVHFSRVAFEANLALAILLSGILLALKSSKKPSLSFLSIPLIILSAYTYHANRVLILPILIGLFLLLRKKLPKSNLFKVKLLVLAIVFILPLLSLIRSGAGFERFKSTSILKIWSGRKVLPLTLVDNSLYDMGTNIAGRYLAYFSPANLFVRGTNEPNQQIHGFGPFYTIEFFFFIFGIYLLAKNNFRPRFLAFLILLGPLPSAITWNWFTLTRILLLLSIFSILIGLGIDSFITYIQKKGKILSSGMLFVLLLLFTTSLGKLATTIFFYIPYMEKGNWQFGFREIMAFVSPIQDNYDKIIFETGHAQPHIFTLFYSKYDPERYHQDLGSPDAVEKPRKNFDFGKYRFRKIYWPEDRDSKDTLYIGSEYSLPKSDILSTANANILTDVYDENGSFVARVVETK